MPLVKVPFRKYSLEDSKTVVLSLKINEKDEELIKIGQYSLNMISRGGTLKELARLGLEEVILNGLGVERWHYLTRGDRARTVHETPRIRHFKHKGNTKYE